ncbi:MAG: glycosyltransferase family 1 protein [Pedobacter sp.]|nr:MAG: glycosyltransferase family 1 protein [Pedobacter sp.]
MRKILRILGTRGVPAAHGGFETFAEHLALYLVTKNWRVIVYCQESGAGPITEDTWQGIERVRIPVMQVGAKGTIIFDWKAIKHASRFNDLCLTLGYNTAVFCSLLNINGIPNLINMDGIEWSRAKWGGIAKTWFWLNEWAGCWLGTHLVADHPDIKNHLQSRVSGEKITTIAYGANAITEAPTEAITSFGLSPGRFFTLIARPEKENSILEIVQGFSAKTRGYHLAVLGNYHESDGYHKAVKSVASREVLFVGGIYDKVKVQALRFHSVAYVHGHQVGGTNPSLVEAMGAGNPIIAHDNRFNRWVAGGSAAYFVGAEAFSARIDEVLSDPVKLELMRQGSRARFEKSFTWPAVLGEYESLLLRYLPSPGKVSQSRH